MVFDRLFRRGTAASFREEALAALRTALGPQAQFHDNQYEAIETLVEKRERLLVVQRTGWGKSAVYFVATRLLRDRQAGLTIIVSPLLALMRDQIEAADRLGLKAVTINSTNQDAWPQLERELLSGAVDLLLISPERLNNDAFRSRLLEPLLSRTGLFVIDEAHCISDWGHDFRPDYRRLVRVLELLPPMTPVLCTTATANKRVVQDIRDQLGTDISVIRGNLDRDSLSLHAFKLPLISQRMAWLANWIPTTAGSGIIYCLTVADTRRVADWLSYNGINAIAYSGETDPELREQIERQLKSNQLKVVVATSALGMGFDKPDLAFVVHFQSPDSPVAYYQQIGRAGRAIDRAQVVLLWGERDQDIWEYFLDHNLPVQTHAEELVAYLAAVADWVTVSDIEDNVNMPQSRITGLLKVLDVEGVVQRSGSKYRRSLQPWSFDAARIDRVRQARLDEHDGMRRYATTASCRMTFIREALDDEVSAPCGRCDNCTGHEYHNQLDTREVARALSFLRNRPITFEPRRRWAGPRSGKIQNVIEPGRTLCYLADPGWGEQLLDAKRNHGKVSDDLVEAAAMVINEWLPTFEGTIVYVPSLDPQRTLVGDFAGRLADVLDIPLSHCIVKTRHNRPQKLMQNSAQQVRNISGVFTVVEPVPPGPVILVDDIVDSRWTMALLGDLLMRAGTGPVHPFAIAKIKG